VFIDEVPHRRVHGHERFRAPLGEVASLLDETTEDPSNCSLNKQSRTDPNMLSTSCDYSEDAGTYASQVGLRLCPTHRRQNQSGASVDAAWIT
jgi:hypothetical protein